MPHDRDSGRPGVGTEQRAVSRNSIAAGVMVIAAAVVTIYWPSVHGGFILDDSFYVTNAPVIQASDGLYRIWCTNEAVDYYPITNTTLWLEWRLWGQNSTGYHVCNLVLHIAACLLLWAILRRLWIPGAFLAALLFAVHPVNVESVAWIAQRKNTLAMVFVLLAVLCYLRQEEEIRSRGNKEKAGLNVGRWYWLSLFVFLLAMLSKGSVVILPLVLLLIVWWQQGTITKWDLMRSAPFFLLAAALTPVILWFVTHGSEEPIRSATFLERLAGAGNSLWFYLAKAVLPIHLIFVYPQWNIRAGEWLWWLPLMAAIAVSALLLVNRCSPTKEWKRPLLFAWEFYVIALLPVLGFSDSGYMKYSLVADHYQHIAMIGVVALAAATWCAWHNRLHRAIRPISTATAIAAIGALMLLSWRQNELYGSPVTLYRKTLEANPESWMVHYNLGISLAKANERDEAIEHFRQTVRINPKYAEGHNNLASTLADAGRLTEAVDEFHRALQLKPEYAMAEANLALALEDLHRRAEAIDAAKKAVQMADSEGKTALAQQMQKWLTEHPTGQATPSTDQ